MSTDVCGSRKIMLYILLFLFLYFNINLALFIVTAPQLTYTARYGDTVHMICNFPVPKEDEINKLKVSWTHVQTKDQEARQVIMFNNGIEDVLSQENMYKGRARLVSQELKNGMAILQIEEVKLTDAGTYVCVLQLEGSDYQEMTLNVQASYSKIATSSHVTEDNEISLTCESLGFPKAEVYWKTNGVNVSSPVNTSHSRTSDGLYRTTSTIKAVDMNQYYNCVFWNEALNEETEALLEHSGNVELLTYGPNYNRFPQRNDSAHQPLHTVIIIIIIIIGCIVISFVVMVTIFYKKRHWCFKCFKKKGSPSSVL